MRNSTINWFNILGMFLLPTVLCGQTIDEEISTIREHFNDINKRTNLHKIELNNEEFLDQVPDNGAQLFGYFSGDTLYKIVEFVGLSYGTLIREFYLWDDELIFVYDVENNFGQIQDSTYGFVGFDYSKLDLVFEGRYYFESGEQIKTIEKGKRLIQTQKKNYWLLLVKQYTDLLNSER